MVLQVVAWVRVKDVVCVIIFSICFLDVISVLLVLCVALVRIMRILLLLFVTRDGLVTCLLCLGAFGQLCVVKIMTIVSLGSYCSLFILLSCLDVVVLSILFSGDLSSDRMVRALGLLKWVPNLIMCSFCDASVSLVQSRLVKGALWWVSLLMAGRIMRCTMVLMRFLGV